MSQEWDFPEKRHWQPEIRVLPGQSRPGRRFDRLVEHDTPKAKTAWSWYRKQMNGGGSWLYKANLTALFLTLCGFILSLIAIASLVAVLLVRGAMQ